MNDNKLEQISVYLTENEIDLVDTLANELQYTRSNLLRRVLQSFLMIISENRVPVETIARDKNTVRMTREQLLDEMAKRQ